MPTLTHTSAPAPLRKIRRGNDLDTVLRSLEEMCASLQPGDTIPTHTELMRRFHASERAVRWGLDELRRRGRIIRRQGSATIVAESTPLSRNGTSALHTDHNPAVTATRSRAIIALANPDHSIFDRAMSMLFRHTAFADLSLTCQFVDPGNVNLPISESEQEPVGYVVFSRQLLPVAQQLHETGQRVVLVGTPSANTTPGVPSVQGDQEQGGYLAARHLLDLGHRRIAFFGWGDWPQTKRYQGHQQALSEARKQGVEVEESNIFHEEYDAWKNAPERARAYFRRPDAPTAVVAWNDHEAMTLLSLLSYIGICVPEDVSLTGYDNLPEGERIHPALTTVDGAMEQQVQAALKLVTQPTPPTPSHTVVVLPTLLRRESTAPPQQN
jgi:hypothetical protein